MTLAFFVILVISCIITCIYTLRKIKKSQLKIEDAFFWIIISIGLVILSVFPSVVEFFTSIIGMQAPSNFIFLVMIFLLLMKVFSLSLKISQMEEKLKNLVQQIAIINNETEKKIKTINKGNS